MFSTSLRALDSKKRKNLSLTIREALEKDLPLMVEMLADDELGSKREDTSNPLNPSYLSAFKNIVSDTNNELILVESFISRQKIKLFIRFPQNQHAILNTWK